MRDTLTPKGWLSVLMLRALANIERRESVASSSHNCPFANPEDGELILEVVSEVGDTVQVWRTTFFDSNPVRLRIIDDDGNEVEAWLSDGDSTSLGRALEVIR